MSTAKIIVSDTRLALRKLPENSVHLIVTSPPYNMGMRYGKWYDRMPFREYLAFTHDWLLECHRVLVDGGRICVNVPMMNCCSGAYSLMHEHFRIMKELSFKEREVIIWVKKRINGIRPDLSCMRYIPKRPVLRHPVETIIIMEKNSSSLNIDGNSDITEEEFLDWTYNMWTIPPETDRSHPAPFPEELPRRLIKLYTYPGNTILDPFLGSGTTMKAALNTGRSCMGIDIDEEYALMAHQRMQRDGYFRVEMEGAKPF